LAIFGIEGSQTSQLLRALSFDNPENLQSFSFFDLIFGNVAGVIATIAGAGAIIVGLFTRQSTESILLAGFTSILAGWVIGDMVSIITTSTALYSTTFPFIAKIMKLYLMVFIGSFIIALIEWWRGSD
jgi:type III secretory pathway component EscS